jgi:integrase
MTQELRKSLRWWWEERPIKDQAHVFLCLDKNQFAREFFGQPFKYRLHFMRTLCDKVKATPFGFHSIRHLSASILFKLGYEVGVIQQILRHKSPNTTERYLRSIGMERVREALEDLKPADPKILPFGSTGKAPENKKAV